MKKLTRKFMLVAGLCCAATAAGEIGQTRLDINLGVFPVDKYVTDPVSGRNGSGDDSIRSCPADWTVPRCIKRLFKNDPNDADYSPNNYVKQGVKGVRFFFALGGNFSSTPFLNDSGQINQAWVNKVKALFADLSSYGIERVTPTPAILEGWTAPIEPDDLSPFRPTTHTYMRGDPPAPITLRFWRWMPYGVVHDDCRHVYPRPPGCKDGDPDLFKHNPAYDDSPPNTEFWGWNPFFNLMREVIRAAWGITPTPLLLIEDFDIQNEADLWNATVQGRLLYDNMTQPGTDVIGAVRNIMRCGGATNWAACEANPADPGPGFDPGRVTLSMRISRPSQAEFDCDSFYGDSALVASTSALDRALRGHRFGAPPHSPYTEFTYALACKDQASMNSCPQHGVEGCDDDTRPTLPLTTDQYVPTVINMHSHVCVVRAWYDGNCLPPPQQTQANYVPTAKSLYDAVYRFLQDHNRLNAWAVFGETLGNHKGEWVQGDPLQPGYYSDGEYTQQMAQWHVEGFKQSNLYNLHQDKTVMRPWSNIMAGTRAARMTTPDKAGAVVPQPGLDEQNKPKHQFEWSTTTEKMPHDLGPYAASPTGQSADWVTEYRLKIGSWEGSADIYSASQGMTTYNNSISLPNDGRSLYVTLETQMGASESGSNAYIYTAPGGTTCTNLLISPTSAQYASPGGSGTLTVVASSDCTWTATKDSGWIVFPQAATGTGNGLLNYSVLSNASSGSRTGRIGIASKTFQITQAGVPACTYALSATSQSVGASGGAGNTVNVIAGSGCAWTAVSNVYWVTITSGSSGSGNGTVMYSVAANSGSPRTGTLTIAGLTHQVIQGAVSANFPPTVDGVTGPTTTGGSTSGQFLSQYSDPDGYTDLRYMYLKVSATGLDSDSCLVLYDRAYNSMWLRDNTNSYYLGPVTPGASGMMENSQCSVSGAYSGQIGWTSTVWWSPWLNFKAAFAGAKNVYLRAQDWTGLDTGWQQKLTWTVGESEYQVPASVSVTPSTGAGASQTFSFVYRDPDGYTDLTQAEAIVNSIMSGVGACYIRYNRSQNLLYLADDGGAFTGSGLAPGTVGTLQNSQCSLNTGGSSVSGSGTDLTVRPAVTFKTAFGGVKTVYLWARDGWGLESGWKSHGIWLAPSTTTAVAVTVYNTGVVSAGVPAADGAVDSHYRLTSSPDAAYPGPNAIVINSTGWPIPPWVGDDSNSKWIGPRRDAGTPNYNAPGTYVYQTTFDLTGLNPVTTVLVGRWATDNSGTIRLNGATVGTASNTFDAFTPFLITNGFVAGVNTLEFVVDNWTTSPSPTGLRVELSGVAAPASSGTPFTVYSTGVTSPGVPAADGAVDSHYTMTTSADPAYPGPNARVINSNEFPIPPWLANDANSKWIGPRRDAGASPYNSPGTYTYRTTFDLTGFVPATAALTGKWATDNSGTIKLNGATVGTASNTFDAFTNFTINSGFIAGVNTLEFVVNNWTTSPSPTGLRVEINGSAGPAVNFTLTLSPTSVVGGGSTTANKVTLDSPAPAGGAAVSLSSSDPSVAAPPATVTVAEGATISPNFTITTSGVAATTAVTIQATYVGASRTATVTVNPAALDTLDLTTSSVAGGNSVTANHVHLTGHAPPSGAVVSLTSSNPAVAAVPASVTVAAGASTSPDFTITTVSVASSTPVTITATYAGVSKTATLTVNPTAALSSLTLSPATVVGGWSPSANTVTLTGPAGPGGAVVTLTSSNSSVATPPASVTVAEGATVSPDFTITTSGVAAQTVVTIQATYMGVTKTATLIVNPAALSTLHGIPSTVVGGNSLATNHVHLTGDAPPSGAVVSLTSSEPAVAAVPASVTVAAGATTSPNFTITTVYVASSTPVTITATYLGVSKTGTLTVNPPTPNTLHLSPSTVVGGVSTTGNHVHLTGPAGPSGAVVTLTSSNPTVASPPASVTVAAGATTSPNFTITTTQVATTTQVTITATHAGESKTGTLTVNPP